MPFSKWLWQQWFGIGRLFTVYHHVAHSSSIWLQSSVDFPLSGEIFLISSLLTKRQLNHTFEDFGKEFCSGKMVLHDIYSAIRRMIVNDGIAFHAAALLFKSPSSNALNRGFWGGVLLKKYWATVKRRRVWQVGYTLDLNVFLWNPQKVFFKVQD